MHDSTLNIGNMATAWHQNRNYIALKLYRHSGMRLHLETCTSQPAQMCRQIPFEFHAEVTLNERQPF